jgi:hypothetical protein
LRTLLLDLSLALGTLLLDLLRFFDALVLDLLLALVLLGREPQPRGSKNDRDGQGTKKLQPLPKVLVCKTRPSKRRTPYGEQDDNRH